MCGTTDSASAAQQTSGNEKAEQEADKESDGKIKEIGEIKEKSGDKVVEDLLEAVTDVRPEPPERG